jgi:hypothetical protein
MERGGLTTRELLLAQMPYYFGSQDWNTSKPYLRIPMI